MNRPRAHAPGTEERLVSLLQIYEVTDRTFVASADPGVLRRCRTVDPDLALSALVEGFPLDVSTLASLGILRAVWPSGRDREGVRRGGRREARLASFVGVVNEPTAAWRLAAWGVAAITTDRPDLIRSALESPG